MAFTIKFNEEKNQLLKATREIGFENIIKTIRDGKSLNDIAHPGKNHLSQRMYVVRIKSYAYTIPYVINKEKQEIFLKTIYPSRRLTKLYLKGEENEKKKKI